MKIHIMVGSVFISSLLICGCGKKEEPAPLAVDIPQQQVEVIAEVEPTQVKEGVGEFCYYPSDKEGIAVPAGTNELCIFFKRDDIVPGTGYISIFDAADDSHVYDVIDVLDEEHCIKSSLDDFGVNYTGWETGTMFKLYLDAPYQAGHTYYFDLTEGNFMTQDGKYFSQGLSGDELLYFSVLSYGIIPKIPLMTDDFVSGDTVNYDIVLGSGAVKAEIIDYDPLIVIPDQTSFLQDGTLNLNFQAAGSSFITINFYDSEEVLIDSIIYSFRVLL